MAPYLQSESVCKFVKDPIEEIWSIAVRCPVLPGAVQNAMLSSFDLIRIREKADEQNNFFFKICRAHTSES